MNKKEKTKNKIKKEHEIEIALVVLMILTGLMILFIFSRSLAPADESSQQSNFVMEYINRFLALFGMNVQVAELFIRKAAHFTEFFAFGILLSSTVARFEGGIKKNAFSILFFLLFVPVLDESLQYLSPGRSPEIKDVLLDFSGCLTGFALVCVMRTILHKRKKKI